MSNITVRKQDSDFQVDLHRIQEMVSACMQCGTCSASCPNVAAMDITPRQMWRMVLMGMTEELFNSRSFWLCSACYTCTLRCPRGLPLTEAVYALKRLAAGNGNGVQKRHGLFYETFVRNIARDGRIQEGRLVADYFLAAKNPVQALRYAPMGMKMLGKGKLRMPSFRKNGTLDGLFGSAPAGKEES
jgi:heterodisulfide reductase subunit C